jgi:8-oxo-dGTP pyrophosphatase MutT (NUDIX family)
MMLLCEMFKLNEAAKPEGHTDLADPNTGFYGKWGAGVIFMARSTGRFLIAHRSDNPPPLHVEQPNTWGTWGGAGEHGETPQQAANREVHEEAGASAHADLIPMYVFKSGTFRYYNFLAIVPDEFAPHLGWEHQGSKWCAFGEWPSPMHFGLTAILNDPASVHTMQQAVEQTKQAD